MGGATQGEGLVENEGRRERRTGSREQWRAERKAAHGSLALTELPMKWRFPGCDVSEEPASTVLESGGHCRSTVTEYTFARQRIVKTRFWNNKLEQYSARKRFVRHILEVTQSILERLLLSTGRFSEHVFVTTNHLHGFPWIPTSLHKEYREIRQTDVARGRLRCKQELFFRHSSQ
jgi:hypothetical protein